jgi:energy-coupling factor transport system permease protein
VAWGPLRLTIGGLADGATLGLRLLVMALAVFLWLYTTESRDIVQGFVRLGLPFSWGLSLSLALRYIPTVGRDYQIITQSQQARGLDPQAKRGLARVRALLPGLLALIVTSFRASENMARALEARAYGAPGVRRSTMNDLRFQPLDWLVLLTVILGTGALIYLRLRFGFGAEPLRLIGQG